MAPPSRFRVALLVSSSVFMTAVLGFGLPALLNAGMRVLGLPETSVTECIVVLYLVFVLYVSTPRLPRGQVQVRGKAVLITGCDRGYGHELAKHMHKVGFKVFAGCLSKDQEGEGAKKLEDLCSDRMKVVQLDVCSQQQVDRAVEYIRDNLDDSERGLWAVVNNASLSTFGEVEFTSMDSYKQVSEVNLWGTIRVTNAVLPLIRRAKGRVVNLASVYGRMGNAMRSSYCVSKYGVQAFSDCLRHEMKLWGVRVSLVEPGYFTVSRDTLTSTTSRLWSDAPAGVKEDYGTAHLEQQMAAMRSQGGGSRQSGVASVLDDVSDALVSRHPYTRYTPCEPHCWLRLQVTSHLPAAVSDYFYS